MRRSAVPVVFVVIVIFSLWWARSSQEPRHEGVEVVVIVKPAAVWEPVAGIVTPFDTVGESELELFGPDHGSAVDHEPPY